MKHEQLLAVANRLGVIADESMTVSEIQSLIDQKLAEPSPAQPIVPSGQGALSTADNVFRKMDVSAMSTFTGVKIVFVAPSKNGCRLIVRKGDSVDTFAVYVFTEAVSLAGVKAGDNVTILAEQRTSKKDGKLYWNATALSKL